MSGIELVWLWWGGLCCITVFNLFLLSMAYRMLQQQLPSMGEALANWRTWQFRLASIYTIGCGFRAVLPRGDLRRIVLFDSWISSIAIGRTVATIAELSFVAQWCFLLHEAGKNTGHKIILAIAKWPFILIFIAECFSWYACTSTNYLGTAIEESLWAIAASLTVYGFYLARPYYKAEQRTFLKQGMLAGIGYVVYMLCVDIPAYISNWQAAEAAGKTYKTVIQGVVEVCTMWRSTQIYSDWEYEMIWMSLYFSVAVWGSIYLVNAPRLDKNFYVQDKN